MPPRQNQVLNEIQEIRPAAPNDAVRGLLDLLCAQILPLPAGNLHTGHGKPGEYTLIAAIKGNFTVTTHAQYALLSPGQVFALHNAGAYNLQSVSDCQCMMVRLQGEVAGRLLQGTLKEGCALFSQGAPAVREAVMALAVLEEENSPVSGAVASSRAYAMLMQLCGDLNGPVGLAGRGGRGRGEGFSPLVESAVSIIQEEFPFLAGLDELAERLEVSKAHLIRTFTQKTGISPGKYITRVRIEYAKLLLRDEDVSITYVAEASGFANANYFAKVFRRETGMSPSEYLENAPKQRGGMPHPELAVPLW